MKEIEGAPALIDALPQRLDRDEVATIVAERLRASEVAPALVVAMIWGHGDSGYGPYRTALVLTGRSRPKGHPADPKVLEKLQQSTIVLKQQGPIEAFRRLNNAGHIAGLGPAFFTKWLYFVSAAEDPRGPNATPILDRLVTSWFWQQTETRLRYARTDDYDAYGRILRAWGEPFDKSPVQVEESIFGLIRDQAGSTRRTCGA